MPWLYPEKMETVRKIFALRERLVPYLSEQMKACIRNDMPLIYPVFLRDEDYDREADCFMCGEKILVCPVFDEGRKEVGVFLPKSGSGFRLRGTGDLIPGKTFVETACSIDDLPVWFTEEK